MAIDVSVDIEKTFEVQCDREKVVELLADVPRSVSHFPKVEQLVDLGGDSYRWEMEKIGAGKYFFQTVYACNYTSNVEEGWVKWTSVSGVGNAQVQGSWDVRNKGNMTSITLRNNGVFTMPFPRLAKSLVSPLVKRELESLLDTYTKNLIETFTGLGS